VLFEVVGNRFEVGPADLRELRELVERCHLTADEPVIAADAVVAESLCRFRRREPVTFAPFLDWIRRPHRIDRYGHSRFLGCHARIVHTWSIESSKSGKIDPQSTNGTFHLLTVDKHAYIGVYSPCMPALRTVQSLGEGMQQARIAAGYARVDDAAEAAGISRDFIYQIERIGNRPNAANPTLSVLRELADLYGVELGDLFPATRVSSEEVREVFDALSAIPAENRRSAVRSISMFIRSIADGMRSDAGHETPLSDKTYNPRSVNKSERDDVVGFTGNHTSEPPRSHERGDEQGSRQSKKQPGSKKAR
jgi:transcriptional regulator with XRE-family HTH domain